VATLLKKVSGKQKPLKMPNLWLQSLQKECRDMSKAIGLLMLLEDASIVDKYKDSLAKLNSPKRKEIIKAAFAKGEKFAVKQGLMKMNKEEPLDPKEYNALLDYMSDLERKPTAVKSKSFASRFLAF